MPVVAFLDGRSPDHHPRAVRRAFRTAPASSDAGYDEGENVTVEYRLGWRVEYERAPGAGGRPGPPTGGRDRHAR